ncbi:hypothetical protein J3R30DRAFT_3248762, partial [Lentinula aciculospora]
ARNVPYLKRDQKRQRVAWEKKMKGLDWSMVVWSDECCVYLESSHNQIFIVCWEDEEYEENRLIPSFKQSSTWIMVWACIMKGVKGSLVVLEYPERKSRGINAQRYQKQVLDVVFLDFVISMQAKSLR